MWILIATVSILLVSESASLGFAAAGLRQKYDKFLSERVMTAAIVLLLAISDVYYLPLVKVLDVTVTIRNPDIAHILGPGSPIELVELLRPDLWSLLWIALNGILSFGFYRFALRRRI